MAGVGRWYSAFFNGFSRDWWSEKHNRHHLCTNEIDNDTDIQTFPLLFLFKPSPKIDAWNRKF